MFASELETSSVVRFGLCVQSVHVSVGASRQWIQRRTYWAGCRVADPASNCEAWRIARRYGGP